MDEAQLLAKYGGLKPKARLIMKVGASANDMPSFGSASLIDWSWLQLPQRVFI